MRPIPLLLLAALIGAGDASAAPVLEPLQPCYRSVPQPGGKFDTEPVRVAGSGFTPGATVKVAIDGTDVDTAVADASGAIAGSVAAPGIAEGERLFTVSATEPANLAQTTLQTAQVTNLTASIAPRRASPRRKVRFSGAGFTADSAVFAHYTRGGRVTDTVKLGRPTGACGTFSVRRKQFPTPPRSGRWQILVDQSRTPGTETPTVAIEIRVKRARSS